MLFRSNLVNSTSIYNDYNTRIKNIQNKYRLVDQSQMFSYILNNNYFLIKNTQSETQSLKTSIYNIDSSLEGYLDYYFISSINTLKNSKIEFFITRHKEELILMNLNINYILNINSHDQIHTTKKEINDFFNIDDINEYKI